MKSVLCSAVIAGSALALSISPANAQAPKRGGILSEFGVAWKWSRGATRMSELGQSRRRPLVRSQGEADMAMPEGDAKCHERAFIVSAAVFGSAWKTDVVFSDRHRRNGDGLRIFLGSLGVRLPKVDPSFWS